MDKGAMRAIKVARIMGLSMVSLGDVNSGRSTSNNGSIQQLLHLIDWRGHRRFIAMLTSTFQSNLRKFVQPIYDRAPLHTKLLMRFTVTDSSECLPL